MGSERRGASRRSSNVSSDHDTHFFGFLPARLRELHASPLYTYRGALLIVSIFHTSWAVLACQSALLHPVRIFFLLTSFFTTFLSLHYVYFILRQAKTSLDALASL